MKEIVKVNLENEMDLILAHKRTMKLGEMCGLSLTSQTALATAVSEIARCALQHSQWSYLSLGISEPGGNSKHLLATICNTVENCSSNTEAIGFARRLTTEVKIVPRDKNFDIQLHHDIRFRGLLTDSKVQSFVDYFRQEPPLSAYDELKRKNILLLELADKLRESENQYRALTDSLPLMMLSLNTTGYITYTNQWLKNYLGTNIVTLNASTWQLLVHPEDYPIIVRDWDASMNRKNAFRAQARLKNAKNSDFLWHLISVLPVRDDGKNVSHWIGFFVDINAQKLIEETLKDNVELKETQKQLVEYQQRLEEKITELNLSNHELEQFAYIASHDLQEPLRKIVTFSALLTDRLHDLDEESKLYFSKIVSSSHRMTNLINDVLDYSRISRSNEQFARIDLAEVVENVKSDFEVLLAQRNAMIRYDSLHSIEGISLQINQLFTNLISNSIKFCERDPVIEITSREVPASEATSMPKLDSSMPYVEIVVRDNGIGFEQQYAEQIFTIFQRLNGRSAYTGTGIGLAICRRIVENHHGQITANSAVGAGSEFHIFLPKAG